MPVGLYVPVLYQRFKSNNCIDYFMKVLITGASGYIGAKIYEGLKNKHNVIGTYNSNKFYDDLIKLDITNEFDVLKLVKEVKPDYIIHIAAIPRGSTCDKCPEKAIAINQEGTRFLVHAANLVNSKMIFMSSFAAAFPKNLYGETKSESEKLVRNVKAGYIILRPSLTLGYSPNTTNNSPFNRLLKNIKDEHEVLYDAVWIFQPTWLKHIYEIIEVILKRNILNELIPIAVPEITTRYGYAKDILAPFNIKVKKDNCESTRKGFKGDLNKLKELDLPEYTYSEIIEGIIKEIKENIKF